MVLSSLYFYWYDYTKYQQLLQGKFEKNVLAPRTKPLSLGAVAAAG
jgi:hypothetical protein